MFKDPYTRPRPSVERACTFRATLYRQKVKFSASFYRLANLYRFEPGYCKVAMESWIYNRHVAGAGVRRAGVYYSRPLRARRTSVHTPFCRESVAI